MRRNSVRYFLLTLIMALLIILPTFALIGAYSLTKVRSVSDSISDIPATKPTEEDDRNILLVVNAEQPTFMLLKFDAFSRSVVCLAMPSELIVSEQKTAADFLEQGGPAMVTTALEDLLDVGIEYYLLLDEQQLAVMTVNFTPATLSQEIATRLGVSSQHVISAEYAMELVAKAAPEDKQLTRSICYSLLLEANMDIMQAEIAARAKELPGQVNTNIGSEELYRLTKIFSLLPYEKINYYAATLNGDKNEFGIAISEDDKNKSKELLN